MLHFAVFREVTSIIVNRHVNNNDTIIATTVTDFRWESSGQPHNKSIFGFSF